MYTIQMTHTQNPNRQRGNLLENGKRVGRIVLHADGTCELRRTWLCADGINAWFYPSVRSMLASLNAI